MQPGDIRNKTDAKAIVEQRGLDYVRVGLSDVDGIMYGKFRIAAADINPYIAVSAALASGLWGIENRIEPDAPVQGNAYDAKFGEARKLPAALYEAASRLRGSSAATELFGEAFVDHYAATREWEEREFRKHITDWEMDRYFEII